MPERCSTISAALTSTSTRRETEHAAESRPFARDDQQEHPRDGKGRAPARPGRRCSDAQGARDARPAEDAAQGGAPRQGADQTEGAAMSERVLFDWGYIGDVGHRLIDHVMAEVEAHENRRVTEVMAAQIIALLAVLETAPENMPLPLQRASAALQDCLDSMKAASRADEQMRAEAEARDA